MTDTAHFFIDGTLLKIDLPFNSKFIKKFRKDIHNTFVWDKVDKVYQTKFSTYALKNAVRVCSDFFAVTYCSELKPVMDFLNTNSFGTFEPTLVKVNDQYYVSGINEPLYQQLVDIELNDSMEVLFKCSLLGIKVDKELLSDPAKEFAATRIYTTSIDNLDLADWIKQLNVNSICSSNRFSRVSAKHKFNLQEFVKNNNIEIRNLNSEKETFTEPYFYIGSVLEHNTSAIGRSSAAKIILLRLMP